MLRAVAAVRAANPAAAYCCDPVIGDVGRGVYVEAGVAEFFAKRALPAATVATPNAFELSFVTDLPSTTSPERGARSPPCRRSDRASCWRRRWR